MLFYSKLKDLYHKLILSKYIIVHNYRIPSNYNNTSTQFVNNNNLSSTTKYLIWVDTKNFQVNIFSGSRITGSLDKELYLFYW